MRNSRMRAVTAGLLGAAMVAIASPAWAADTPTPTPTSTSCTTPSPTASAAAAAAATPSTEASASAGTTESASPATPTAAKTTTAAPCGILGGLGELGTTKTPEISAPAAPSTSASPSPGVIVIPGIGPINLDIKKDCDAFNSFSPVKLPCDKQITGIQDFVPNPLIITAKCGPDGPIWTVTNTGTAALGFGWFDINLGGGVSMIAPGETQTLNSHSIAVIASPWDAKTSTLLVAIPAVGYSTCPGGTSVKIPPIALPVAPPATGVAVPGTPHFTG
ncbi:hypothetical protein I6A60_38435 [Frankia sp. AgB1.9]|uniref:hypothetical protein n=1 Tax=unclassified Frankia TaxID=2632575 RepID=UPI0019314D11|nr:MULTISPECIES: hypothetical protein [unclassified Frankia]MBL7489036.1 hypothetical protein [Frankia sp. AgW1.1]MBL7553667.1 hypothetical protein [Frankia sp. AgB1.9]